MVFFCDFYLQRFYRKGSAVWKQDQEEKRLSKKGSVRAIVYQFFLSKMMGGVYEMVEKCHHPPKLTTCIFG